MLNRKFAAVLIDPAVIAELEYDFLGVNSVALPALYELLARNGTALLDCDVLYQKIKSGIHQSALIEELQQLCSFCDGLDMLKLLGQDIENAVSVLKGIDLQQQLTDRFEQLYVNATKMTACNVNEIITLYYSKLPPFDNVDEDFEMSDAFVLSTFIDYANNHVDKRFLVVSNNDDWREILGKLSNVTVVYSAEQVMEKWLPENSFARQLFRRFQQKIVQKVYTALYQCDYVMANDGKVMPKVYVDEISVDNRCVSPLLVTDSKAVYRVDVDIDVYGNYERLYCLFENDHLVSINDGSASVSLEVEITYDNADIDNTADVSTVKVIDRDVIPVYERYCD